MAKHEREFHNEIDPELIGNSHVNPFVMHDSPSRIAMANKQIGQALVVAQPDVPIWLTGVEREYGKYTHGVDMPANARIIQVIEKYRKQLSDITERPNPQSVVIFENMEPNDEGVRVFDAIEIDTYHRLHMTWGHRQEAKEGWEKLTPGEYIKKGTPLVGSPNVDAHGNYRNGVEANVALFTHPAGIEDGVGIRRGFLPKLRTRAYGRRIVSYSEGKFPLNLYGDNHTFKAFPDIGDTVRDDGILLATRQYDEALAPLQLMPGSLRKPNKLFDDPVYAIPGAKVVDVNVFRDKRAKTEMPTGVSAQFESYWRKLEMFYKDILDAYNKINRQYANEPIRISPRFSNLVTNALFYLNQGGKERIDFFFKKVPVGEWYVEVIFEYELDPTYGSKMTGYSGDKGVCVYIFEDEDAPVDANGDKVDIIMDADSTIKRMNLGRLIRQYGSSSARKTQLNIIDMVKSGKKEDYLAAYDYALGWYAVASPEHHDVMLKSISTETQKVNHVKDIVKDGFHVYRPVNSREPATVMIEKMLEQYPATYAPIRYKSLVGKWVTTVDPILVGKMYMLLLDKMADSYGAIASPKFQHHGIPAKGASMDKYAAPGRSRPLRVFGETEFRILTAVGAGPAAVEAHDQSNNPSSQREVVREIQMSDNPMQIPEVINRKMFPLGFARPQLYVEHSLLCGGVRFTIKENKQK